ncbi:scarecrow-like protein 3 [Cucurbita moschata]|uniref:Scarecrow-like protein 3 n=1 Tax=Cucurbita moschata TaxID=3662 RepID=A0A6J1H860_CUCMO|nr:scarecrow-like protein 3 [Cucurbita moschata]
MIQDEGISTITSTPLQFFTMMPLSPKLGSPYLWLRELKSEERGLYLIHFLLTCANHVAVGRLDSANLALDQISHLASADGDTMQRIAAYFAEALADRVLKTWPGLYKAFNSTKIPMVSEEILVKKLFFEMFPFLKVAFVLTNQAIVEAMEGEKMIHIIDLNGNETAQWLALMQVLSARPEGPPHLRITGVHPQKEILDQMAPRLTEVAEKLDIPFQFNSVISQLEDLDIEKLRVKTGEALAINSVLQLHTLLGSDEVLQKPSSSAAKSANVVQYSRYSLSELLDKDLVHRCSPSPDSVSSSALSQSNATKINRFLDGLWSLTPKVMVVTEQDCNHNGSTLMERLLEALHTYAAIFDCLESNMSRTSVERLKLEKMLFGEEIKNIIACEGVERKERHEKHEKWCQRFHIAGFRHVSLSYYGMLQAHSLLQGYGCDGYRMKEENGCVMICWQDRPLFTVSAWRCCNRMNIETAFSL